MMRFSDVPGSDDIIMWSDESGSGIAAKGDDIWQEYQAFIDAGGNPAQPVQQHVDMATAMAMVSGEVDRVSSECRAGYTQTELDSWPLQDAEAKAWLASTAAMTPMLDAMMLPWEDKRDFCEALLAQHATTSTAIGELMAWRRIAEAAIEAYFVHGPRDGVTIRYPDVPTAL